MPRSRIARVHVRRALGVDARRPAREDERRRLRGAATSSAVMSNGTISRVDARLAHAARDELRVLRAEVEDEDGGAAGRDSRATPSGPCRRPASFCRTLPSVCSDGATMTSAFWNVLRFS